MKNSDVESVIDVVAPGYNTYNGEIVDMKAGSYVTIRYKQPRRPKLSQKQIAWSDVVAVSGDIGEVGFVIEEAGSASLVSGKGFFDEVHEKYATAIVNDTKLTVNTANAKITSFVDKLDDEGGTSKKAKAKGKAAKGKTASKKRRKK